MAVWQKDAILHAKEGLKPEDFFKKQLCEENEVHEKVIRNELPPEYKQPGKEKKSK